MSECKTENKEPSVEVIAWEVTATVAGELLGAGLEGGAKVASKKVDEVVQTASEMGISTATSVVGKKYRQSMKVSIKLLSLILPIYMIKCLIWLPDGIRKLANLLNMLYIRKRGVSYEFFIQTC